MLQINNKQTIWLKLMDKTLQKYFKLLKKMKNTVKNYIKNILILRQK